MSRYKGVIFDLDGTLLNTIADLSNSANAMLEHFNHPTHTSESYKQKIGKGFRDLITQSMPKDVSEQQIDEGLQVFLTIYDHDFMKETKPYDGIEEMLEQLKKHNIKVAVNSNKRDDYTNALIHKNFPSYPFIGCYGERINTPKKPDPTSAIELALMMGLENNEVLYVGDSKTDIITAKNAGMDSIGVDWGFREEAELRKHNATYVVKSPNEIVNIIISRD